MSPLRQHVWKLPEIKPLVTEFQRRGLTCDGIAFAPLPDGVRQWQSGLRLVALECPSKAGFLSVKRRTSLFLPALFRQPCWKGLARVRYASADQLLAPLAAENHLNIDDSFPQAVRVRTGVAGRFTVFGMLWLRAAALLNERLVAIVVAAVQIYFVREHVPSLLFGERTIT